MQVGYVSQTPYIMPGTLAENVAFSQWGKPYNEERVRWACRLAALDIAETRGIEMPIGEKGAGLSGGQAQRLSIARALYVNPSLLILDEATSSLDTAVETAIMNTIYSLPKSITIVIIAHRLSTVRRCDILLWIDKGKLVEFGSTDVVLPKYTEFLAQHILPGSVMES
jgi:ABC-type multidrug transport system fused ATPase/permease subunit